VDRTARRDRTVVAAVAAHQERFDGTGYPGGLAGDRHSAAGARAGQRGAIAAMCGRDHGGRAASPPRSWTSCAGRETPVRRRRSGRAWELLRRAPRSSPEAWCRFHPDVDGDAGRARRGRRLFETLGYEVFREASGETAIGMYLRQRPGPLVILDLRLPGMHGLQVLAGCRRHDASVLLLRRTATSKRAARAIGGWGRSISSPGRWDLPPPRRCGGERSRRYDCGATTPS